ncbi:MAG TPA: uroporphyrinogen-III synthase [Bacteroidota bacterium]|jgi:uroporphyrinogen-III synthase|nr:uroporphyrinogen-III synthase [Bacteroidota bacterium]
MSLSKKRILITRSAHQARELLLMIEDNGGIAVLFPTIEIVPPADWDACDRALHALTMYDGIIFTSANGVEFFFRRMEELKLDSSGLNAKLVCAVGEKTEQALSRHGLAVTVMPENFTAADLSRKLESEDLREKTFLFPKGNLGSNIVQDNLKLLGASVDPVIVYRTIKPEQHAVDEVRATLMDGGIDIATFTSPSTFKNFCTFFSHGDLSDIFMKTKIAVIGPVTSEAVRNAGFEPAITAKQQTIDSLVESINEYCQALELK